jgi:hypothetical protein
VGPRTSLDTVDRRKILTVPFRLGCRNFYSSFEFRYYHGIWLEGLRKDTKKVSIPGLRTLYTIRYSAFNATLLMSLWFVHIGPSSGVLLPKLSHCNLCIKC